MKFPALSLAIALASAASLASAEDAGFYAGAKIGAYDIDLDVAEFTELAWGAYGGYRFNQYVSLEGEYIKLEEDSDGPVDLDGDFMALSVRPSYPLNEQWEVYGKLGWGWLDADASAFGVSATEEDDDFVWGVGTTWTGARFHLRGEIQGDGDAPDFMIYTIGIGFDF